jgi:hypothetical protein
VSLQTFQRRYLAPFILCEPNLFMGATDGFSLPGFRNMLPDSSYTPKPTHDVRILTWAAIT